MKPGPTAAIAQRRRRYWPAFPPALAGADIAGIVERYATEPDGGTMRNLDRLASCTVFVISFGGSIAVRTRSRQMAIKTNAADTDAPRRVRRERRSRLARES
jgi:hypothetical protein